MLSLFLIVAVSDPAAQPEPLKIDILVKQAEAKCNSKSSDEIVVCAEKADNEQHRLRPITNAAVCEKDKPSIEREECSNVVTVDFGRKK